MTLDASVMNVSIATVAEDVGATVTGIQGAITAYTLVMAALMLTGAKIGALIGRKRALRIGLVIYASGSFTTAIAPNLPYFSAGRSWRAWVRRSSCRPSWRSWPEISRSSAARQRTASSRPRRRSRSPSAR
jgi:MFS family permease